MAFWSLLAGTVLYVATSVGFALKGNHPMSQVFVGYAYSNLWFLYIAWKALNG